MKKQIKTGVLLFFGLAFSIPSIEKIFQMIFIEQFKGGNLYSIFGLIPTFLVGIILTLNSIVIIAGYKNLGEFWKKEI